MNLDSFYNILSKAHQNKLPLNSEQEEAFKHTYKTPLWIIAGPGTGKTHTLVWLVLKRILVDGIDPERIILTTFTRKAAAELESRIIQSRQILIDAGSQEAEAIDLTRLHIGTLHSLCSDILQNQRYEPTLRIRILEDELVQQFFLRRSRNPLLNNGAVSFWQRFGIAKQNDNFAPIKSVRTEGACKLFNRMTENSVDVNAMMGSGDQDYIQLAEGYQKYQEDLREKYRTDQAHLQRHFLDFLDTPEGEQWIANGFTVLVDEYQDTNPIQEEIYFRLAKKTRDLTVVGDDDQSLYRFRGATVESLIDFDRACKIYLNTTPKPVYLSENRRSHPKIVDFVSRYIKKHPDMKDPVIRVRAPGKPELKAASNITGNYPAVMAIARSTHRDAAHKMASTIQEMLQEKLVSDPSQIALLTFSTRESSQSIGAYTEALELAGIPYYNPRNRRAQRSERFKALIGALTSILDPDDFYLAPNYPLPRNVPQYVASARAEYLQLAPNYSELVQYVNNSVQALKQASPDSKNKYLVRKGGRRVTLSGLLYKLLSFEPFATDLGRQTEGERFKVLNLILAEYESLYYSGEILLSETPNGTSVDNKIMYPFYATFIEGIHDGLNDPEDDEVSIQEGMVNVMTIHQSKGLEFEVVFVLRPDKQPFLSDTHIMEDEFDAFSQRPTKPKLRRSQDMRAAEDGVRLFFVAYSRAKRLLVLTGSNFLKWQRALGADDQGRPITSESALKDMGVHFL